MRVCLGCKYFEGLYPEESWQERTGRMSFGNADDEKSLGFLDHRLAQTCRVVEGEVLGQDRNAQYS